MQRRIREYGAEPLLCLLTGEAPLVVALQASSCTAGFVGWLFWTYDTDTPAEQPQWYSMVDEHDAIGAALAPRDRPDPCHVVDI